MIYLVKGLRAEGVETIRYLQGRLCSDGAGITVERAGRGLRLIIDIAKLSTIVAVRSILSELKAVLGEDKSTVSALHLTFPSIYCKLYIEMQR